MVCFLLLPLGDLVDLRAKNKLACFSELVFEEKSEAIKIYLVLWRRYRIMSLFAESDTLVTSGIIDCSSNLLDLDSQV